MKAPPDPSITRLADIPTPEDATALGRLADARDRLYDIVVGGEIAHEPRDDEELRHVPRDAGEPMALADEVRALAFDVRAEDLPAVS